jgi:hypothetical protein
MSSYTGHHPMKMSHATTGTSLPIPSTPMHDPDAIIASTPRMFDGLLHGAMIDTDVQDGSGPTAGPCFHHRTFITVVSAPDERIAEIKSEPHCAERQELPSGASEVCLNLFLLRILRVHIVLVLAILPWRSTNSSSAADHLINMSATRTLTRFAAQRALWQKPPSWKLQTRLASSSIAPSQKLNIGGRDVSIPTGIFINNEFRQSIGGNTFGVEDPTTGKEVIRIQEGREEDVDEAVRVARNTFNSKEWAESNPVMRGELLRKLAELMERDKEDIVAIEMLDTGKTYKQAAGLDFMGSVGTLKYYAGWADKILGLTSFNIPGTFAYTRKEPIGVCGQIIPWK